MGREWRRRRKRSEDGVTFYCRLDIADFEIAADKSTQLFWVRLVNRPGDD